MGKALALLFLVVCCFISSINCKLGVNFLAKATTAALKCIKSKGFTNLMYSIIVKTKLPSIKICIK